MHICDIFQVLVVLLITVQRQHAIMYQAIWIILIPIKNLCRNRHEGNSFFVVCLLSVLSDPTPAIQTYEDITSRKLLDIFIGEPVKQQKI